MLGRYDYIVENQHSRLSIDKVLSRRPFLDNSDNAYWDFLTIPGRCYEREEWPRRKTEKDIKSFNGSAVGLCLLKSRVGKENREKLGIALLGRAKDNLDKSGAERSCAYELYSLYTWQDYLLMLYGSPRRIIEFVKNGIRGDIDNQEENTIPGLLRETSTLIGIQISSEDEVLKERKPCGRLDVLLHIKLSPGKYPQVKEEIESVFENHNPSVNWRVGWYDALVELSNIELWDVIVGSMKIRSMPDVMTTTSAIRFESE